MMFHGLAQKEQVGVFAAHHVAERVVAQVAFPVLELAVAHEDMVVVAGLEEGRAGCRSRASG